MFLFCLYNYRYFFITLLFYVSISKLREQCCGQSLYELVATYDVERKQLFSNHVCFITENILISTNVGK